MSKENPLKPPPKRKVKSPILEDAKRRGHGPGGPHTPGAKKKKRKNADSEGHRLTGVNQ